jgi:hypothetical protein
MGGASREVGLLGAARPCRRPVHALADPLGLAAVEEGQRCEHRIDDDRRPQPQRPSTIPATTTPRHEHVQRLGQRVGQQLALQRDGDELAGR